MENTNGRSSTYASLEVISSTIFTRNHDVWSGPRYDLADRHGVKAVHDDRFRATNAGTSLRPIAPAAPATNTSMTRSLAVP
jgi:hypothetical protein